MRRTTLVILALSALAATGCGGGSTFANDPRPPTPVNLSIYINDARVSISPSRVGAGPIVFVITNQAARTETLTILPTGPAGQPLANTGPINPQATSQVTVNVTPGDYMITTAPNGAAEASLTGPPAIAPASLHIGPTRPSSSNSLLQP
jgi:hypothetical protein